VKAWDTRPRQRFWDAALCLAPLILAASAIFFVRAFLGFQFPVPWPDETGFVSPAFELAYTGSLFDPGMNPDRTVMWMPPGYMVVLAAAFRLFGYSFALARWVSAACCLAALGLASALALRYTAGWQRVAACWVVGLAFLSPYMLIDANIARMEMPLAALLLLALMAAWGGRLYVALALVIGASVIHFNAVYFLPPVLLAFAAALWRGRWRWPGTGGWIALIAACAAWLLYAAHIALNWRGFQDDIGFQFALKRFVSQNDPAHPLWPVLAGAALAAATSWWRRLDGASLAALFGLSFLVMARNGHEIWYDYGQSLGFALIAVALLAAENTAGRNRRRIAMRNAASVLAITLVCIMGLRMTDTMRALRPHRAMLSRGVVAPEQIAQVRGFIRTLPRGVTINFGWTGMENFFLTDMANAGAHWIIVRHSVTQTWPLRAADWRIVCDSSEWPPMLFAFDIDHPRHGVDSGCVIIPLAQDNAPRR